MEYSDSFKKQILNFLGSLTYHVISGMPTVTDEEIEVRLSTCRECPNFDSMLTRCGVCGCLLGIKAKWADQDCPICSKCGRKQEEHTDGSCEFVSKWGPKISLKTVESHRPESSEKKCGGCGNRSA